jgi:hypothetical protein
MKYLVFLILLVFTINLHSQKIVVFSKTENCIITGNLTSCNPENPDKREFLRNFADKANTHPANLAKARLITPPLEWGKKVSDSTYGELDYLPAFKLGFYVNLQLFNLLANHEYLLCLNGNPKLAGNDLLPDTVPNLNIERYLDFLSVKTDPHGNYQSLIGISLKPGDYDVRLYVKDTNGFKIVLYHDYFKFTVTGA